MKIFPILKKITTVVAGGTANVLPRTTRGILNTSTVTGTPTKPSTVRGMIASFAPASLVGVTTRGTVLTTRNAGTLLPATTRGATQGSVLTMQTPPLTTRGARITQIRYDLTSTYGAGTAASTGSAWTAPTNAQGAHDAANATIAGSATAAINGTLTMNAYPSCPNKTALTITSATLRYWYAYTAGSTISAVSSITLAHKFGAGSTVTDFTSTTTTVAAGSHTDVDVTAALNAAGGFSAVNTLTATAVFTAAQATGASATGAVDAVELIIVAGLTEVH